MNQDMLEIDDEVQGNQREHNGQWERNLEVIEQAPAFVGSENGNTHGGGRKYKSQDECIQKHQSKVVGPAHYF